MRDIETKYGLSDGFNIYVALFPLSACLIDCKLFLWAFYRFPI